MARQPEPRWISVLILGPHNDGEDLAAALPADLGRVKTIDGYFSADPSIDALMAMMETVRDADVVVTMRPLGRWGMFLLGAAVADRKVVIEFGDKKRVVDHPLVLHYEDQELVPGSGTVDRRGAVVGQLVSTWNRECHGGMDLAERVLRASHAKGMLGDAARFFDDLVPDLAEAAALADVEVA